MIAISIALVLIAFMVLFGAANAQRMHYDFLTSKHTHQNIDELSSLLNSKIKEIDEMRKKVDALVLKNGFKL